VWQVRDYSEFHFRNVCERRSFKSRPKLVVSEVSRLNMPVDKTKRR
jgi:hypothetical protein